jgi:hypothetical protein
MAKPFDMKLPRERGLRLRLALVSLSNAIAYEAKAEGATPTEAKRWRQEAKAQLDSAIELMKRPKGRPPQETKAEAAQDKPAKAPSRPAKRR